MSLDDAPPEERGDDGAAGASGAKDVAHAARSGAMQTLTVAVQGTGAVSTARSAIDEVTRSCAAPAFPEAPAQAATRRIATRAATDGKLGRPRILPRRDERMSGDITSSFKTESIVWRVPKSPAPVA